MNVDGQTDDSTESPTHDGATGKPKRKSRWVRDSGIPRYDKRTLDAIGDVYIEGKDWHNGAKVRKV